MSAERVPSKAGVLRLAGSEPGGRDAITAWLDLLEKMLSIPAREAGAIRDELESHLRDRVTDLEVTGMGEDDAVRQAVSELGDATALARRFHEARAFPRRRLLMNMSMLAMAGAAVALSVVTLSQPRESARVSVFEPPEPTAAERSALSKGFDTKLENVPLKEVFERASRAIDVPVVVIWRPIEEQNVSREMQVTITERAPDFPAFLNAVSEQVFESTAWTLDYRVQDGAIKVATSDYFDRREIVLASYDLRELDAEEAMVLIKEFVYPTGWVDNGGDLAKVAHSGPRLFVQAPKRYHAQIKWFIDELSGDPKAAGVTPGDAATPAETSSLVPDKVAMPQIDAPAAGAPRRTRIVRLEHASAPELAATLSDAADWKGRVNIAGDPRTNSIVLTAEEKDMDVVLELIAELENAPTRANPDPSGAAERDRLVAELRETQAQLAASRQRLVELATARSQPSQDPMAPPGK